MRLNINLATQPYEAARHYRQRMTILIAALGIAAIALGSYIVSQRLSTRSINRQLTDVQRQIEQLNQEESQARAILDKPANRVIADQSEFLNELFARKSLSWTRIFTEMEKIVPSNLHVVSMKPEYTKTNDLVLHILVATDSRDRAVELVRHMEKSNHFRQPQVVAEALVANTSDQAAGGGNIQFDIAAIYLPTGADDEPAASSDKAAENTSPGESTAATVAAKKPALSAGKPAAQPNVNAAQAHPVRPGPGGQR